MDHKSMRAPAKFQDKEYWIAMIRGMALENILHNRKQDFVKYNFISCCVDLSHMLDRSNRTLPGCSFPGILGY